MKRRFDYALVLIESLKQHKGEFVNVGAVAKEFRLPRSFLEKVAQELRRAGWVESRKGAGGGYRLAKDSGAVSIQNLINFYEPIYSFCPLLRKSEARNLKSETNLNT